MQSCYHVISDEKSIAIWFNNCFDRLGKYNSKIIASKMNFLILREKISNSAWSPEENYEKLLTQKPAGLV